MPCRPGEQRNLRIGEPGRPDDAEARQRLVDQAVLRIEDPDPHDADRHQRRHGRQVEDGAVKLDPAQLLVEQDGHPERQHDDADRDAEGEGRGLDEAAAELVVVQKRGVVLEPDPIRRRRHHVPVVEAQVERVADRETDEEREEGEGRRYRQPSEPRFLVPPARSRRQARRRCGGSASLRQSHLPVPPQVAILP
jgi:hypothetical protein